LFFFFFFLEGTIYNLFISLWYDDNIIHKGNK